MDKENTKEIVRKLSKDKKDEMLVNARNGLVSAMMLVAAYGNDAEFSKVQDHAKLISAMLNVAERRMK